MPTPICSATTPSSSDEIGMIPIASSCMPRARPCTPRSVVISSSVVCSTPNAALARPIPIISTYDSTTDCESPNSAQKTPHAPVPKTNSAPLYRKSPIDAIVSEPMSPPAPAQVSSSPSPEASSPSTSSAKTGTKPW